MRTDAPDPCRPASLPLFAAVLFILSAGLLALAPISRSAEPESAQPPETPGLEWVD